MKNQSLIIEKKYLIFRDQAKNLSQIIQKKAKAEKDNAFFLDFSKTRFFSRSFIDELLNLIADLKKKKIIINIINLNPSFKKIFQKIAEKKTEIEKELTI